MKDGAGKLASTTYSLGNSMIAPTKTIHTHAITVVVEIVPALRNNGQRGFLRRITGKSI
jgi:hypothetical protein